MFALQLSSPRLGPPVAALVGLLLVAGFVGAVGNAIVRSLSNPVGKYRLLYAAVLFPMTLLAYALLALLGFGAALVALVGIPTPIGGVLANFAEFLAAGLVWLAGYAPTIRGVRAARDIELSTGSALVTMARYVVALSALVASLLAPLQFAPSGASPLAIAVVLAVVVLVLLFGSPWLVPVLRSTHEPAGETADRIATLRDRAGLDVRDVLVLDTDGEETANTLVRGPPGYRRLFVTSTFLDAFDDEAATALLAIETGRLKSHALELRVETVLVAGVALVASVTGVGPRWPLLAVSAAVLVGGFWASRRGVRAADAYAAERAGAEEVARALERYAEVHALEPTRRRVPNPLSANVALGDRIARLD